MNNNGDIQQASNGSTSKRPGVFDGLDPAIRIRTKKMMMYFIIFAVTMLFAGFTSGYIVKQAGEFWVHVNAPQEMFTAIVWVVLSSVAMVLSLIFMKKGKKSISMLMLILTFVGGVGFSYYQFQGWKNLSQKGMGFSTSMTEEGQKLYSWNRVENITGEYGVDYFVHKNGERLIFEDGDFYAGSDNLKTKPLTHKVHQQSNVAVSFIFVLVIMHFLHLLLGMAYMGVNLLRISKNVIHPGDTIRLYTNGMYWHFMGALWIYLFVFLFFIH